MPTYEYACATCGQEFEVFQSIKDDALKTCNCGQAGQVRRKIGAGAGLIFKGSGFYETDYRRKPAGNSEGGSQASSSDSASTPKTDAKPAAAPAPTPPASKPSS